MASDLYRITRAQTHHVLELLLPETIDTVDIDRLMDAVLAELEGHAGGRWVIDLGAVDYMGSSMLGLVVNVREKIKQGRGKLALCCLSPQMLNVFRTCCLERLFTISKTRPDALAAVGAA